MSDRLHNAFKVAHEALLAERAEAGHWVGELSTSALSTAVAIGALSLVDRVAHERLITGGLEWLAKHQNADGGWGDTVVSFSNISTTMLCRAAVHLGGAGRYAATLERCNGWLAERYGSTPAELAEAVRQRYGKDRTFSVPILMTSALAGLVPWAEVPALPYEVACVPQSWYRFMKMPVVSYALPALIAIGNAVRYHRGSWNPLRWLAIWPSLRVLAGIQPTNGGFLEATPLTSFVAMALASTGRQDHPVVRKCVEFIVASVREDGSWPIDTNLATWVTTLSVNALATAGVLEELPRREEVRSFLRRQQYVERHPYTGAEPGAWAWTDLPGGVPDADDTPGALLALHHLQRDGRDVTLVPDAVAGMGLLWLLDLQNRDGGWPTFCRGWGLLPFDRSGTDLTAHALRALQAWKPGVAYASFADFMRTVDATATWGAVPGGLERRPLKRLTPARVEKAMAAGLAYLAREQREDGAWLPLWFGNQHAAGDENPTYGTAKVLAAYRDLGLMDSEPARRGLAWLRGNQNDDGGWGGGRGTPSSVEETALAVEVLLSERGVAWLVERVERGPLTPTPIGFYFAKLWYFERLYPLAFTVAALGRALHQRRAAGSTPAGSPRHT